MRALTRPDRSNDGTQPDTRPLLGLDLAAAAAADGVFAFRPEINDHWDFRIWLHVDAGVSLRRGARRDEGWAGVDAEAVHRDRYQVPERLYVDEVVPMRQADVAVDNSEFDRPRIVLGAVDR